jgi:negative regulator of flagellin synthesis FlgM
MDVQNNLQGLQEILGISATDKARAQSSVTTEATEGAEAASQGGDQTSLSTAANLVSHAATLPDVRTGKVSAVQQALADGNYQISSSDVAAKMIDSMLGK